LTCSLTLLNPNVDIAWGELSVLNCPLQWQSKWRALQGLKIATGIDTYKKIINSLSLFKMEV
jgi:hypothetical protein